MDKGKKKELKEEMKRVNAVCENPLGDHTFLFYYRYAVKFKKYCLSKHLAFLAPESVESFLSTYPRLSTRSSVCSALSWFWRNVDKEQAPDPFQGPAYQALREWRSKRGKERYARMKGSSENGAPQDPATKTPSGARQHATRSLNGTSSSTTAHLHVDTDSDEHFSASESDYKPQLSSKKRKKNEPVKERVPSSQLSRSAAAPFRRWTGQEGMLASDTSDKASQTHAADLSRSEDGSEADSSSEDSSDEDTPPLTRKARMAFIELPQSSKSLPLRSTTARQQSPPQRNATPGPSGIQHTPPPPHRNATPGPSGVEHTPPPPATNTSSSVRSPTVGSSPPSQRADDAQPRVAAPLSVQQRLEALEQERQVAQLDFEVAEMKYKAETKKHSVLEARKRTRELVEAEEQQQGNSGQR